MQHATNATLKMYEMIVQMRLFVCEDGPLPKVRVFGNAELPGAFIIADNHYIQTMCPRTDFDWLASSYLPEAAMAAGDDTILDDAYGIRARHRKHWLMGPAPNARRPDSLPITGDVTDPDVLAVLAESVHGWFSAAAATDGTAPKTLYTSDAGIDITATAGGFAEQEEETSAINYGQVVAGLLTLLPGGHFITKQYTFFTMFSRSLIALIASFFDETFIVKPLTSRPANSEVYIVGKGFRGISYRVAALLLQRSEAYRAAQPTLASSFGPVIRAEAYADTDAILLRVAAQVHGRQQVSFLNEIATVYEQYKNDLSSLGRTLYPVAQRCQSQWLEQNPVRKIGDEKNL